MRMRMSLIALAAGAVAGLLFATAFAFAQDATTSSLIDQACANNGEMLKWAAGIFGTSTAASLLANFRSRLPVTLVKVLDIVALNLFAFLKAAAQNAPKAAPVLLLAVALPILGACQITGNVSADTQANIAKLQAFAPQVQAFNADALAKIDAFNKGALTDIVVVGKAACGDAAMLDGAFQLAKPIMLAASVDPKVLASEAGVMVGVNLGCRVIAAADTSNPPATVASAVTTVITALPQLKAALANGPPAAAAAASAPTSTAAAGT